MTVEVYRPKIDAIIVQLLDDRRIISIECINKENLPTLEKWARIIMEDEDTILDKLWE